MVTANDSTQSGTNRQALPAYLAEMIMRGFHLFPVHTPISADTCSCRKANCDTDNGKHPRVTNWQSEATTDPRKLKRWLRPSKWAGTNFGVASGPSRLVIIDEDAPDEFERYCDDNGIRSSEFDTFTVSTGKGRHFYFTVSASERPIGNSGYFRSKGYEIDVRANGGYVVAPGSVHRTGTAYEVTNNVDPLPLPIEIASSLATPGISAGRPSDDGKIADAFRTGSTDSIEISGYGRAALAEEVEKLRDTPHGNRNNQLNAGAFVLARLIDSGHLSESVIREEMGDAARTVGHSEARISQTLDSAIRSGKQDPRTDVPELTKENNDAMNNMTSSWAPVDLTAYLDGTHEPKKPTLLSRTDGQMLLYPGAMHSIYGEPGSGKSWAFLLAAKEVLERPTGERVLLIDFESQANEILDRLTVLGVPKSAIQERFTYVRPEQKPGKESEEYEALISAGFSLVGIDGLTACLALYGYKGDSGDDIATWINEFPKRFSRSGASVLWMDHVTKSQDGRGRFATGSQYKLGAIDGAAFTIKMTKPFGRHLRGEAEIRLTKDRSGWLQSIGTNYRDQISEIGTLILDTTDPDKAIGELRPPGQLGSIGSQVESAGADTDLRERVSRFIEENPGANSRALRAEKFADNNRLLEAISRLESDGHIRIETAGKAKLHHSMNPYRQPTGYRVDFRAVS